MGIHSDVLSQKIQNFIHLWISCLIEGNPYKSLSHSSFYLEDGMSYDEYYLYEKKQFENLSSIFDLDKEFSIDIKSCETLAFNKEDSNYYGVTGKYLVTFYVYNRLGKIVFKNNITLVEESGRVLLSSNNYLTQFVPKYSILYDNGMSYITHISLAIKTNYAIEGLICPNFSLESFFPGDNYLQDKFYHARFILEEPILLSLDCSINEQFYNQFYSFSYLLKDKQQMIHEKRKVFFDIVDVSVQPFIIDNDRFIVNDQLYPVHLSYWKNKKSYQYEYPRNVSFSLEGVEKIIMTDCLDNDWNIFLRKDDE